MGRRASPLTAAREFVQRLARDFHVERVILFGSQADGTATADSDIDLIIVSPDFARMNSLARAARMYDYWTADRAVDFLCCTPEEFERLKGRVSIVRAAVRDGVVVQ